MKKYFTVEGTFFTRSSASHDYTAAIVRVDTASNAVLSEYGFRATHASAMSEANSLSNKEYHKKEGTFFTAWPVVEITAKEFKTLNAASKAK